MIKQVEKKKPMFAPNALSAEPATTIKKEESPSVLSVPEISKLTVCLI